MLMYNWVHFSVFAALSACSLAENVKPQESYGRFIDAWGVANVAELSSVRTYRGNNVTTEILVPRRIGELKDGGEDVLVVGLRMQVNCEPVSYDFDRQTNYDIRGAVMSVVDISGAPFSSDGPYSNLARELCNRTAEDAVDFRSVADFRRQASSRPGGTLIGSQPTIGPD